MRDIFISTGGRLLADWQQACPEGAVFRESAALNADIGQALIWLHVNADSTASMLSDVTGLLGRFAQARVLVLANAPDTNEAVAAFQQGAAGYCHAYSSADVLREVRRVVQLGGVWLGPEVLQRLITVGRTMVGSSQTKINATLEQLTPREREVALKAAEGLSNKLIARELDITERTVKAHLTAIFERLAIRDRLQLALMLNDRQG
jgi:DNA-binding NarL/FixJ family response regulator